MTHYCVARGEIDKVTKKVVDGTNRVLWVGTNVRELETKFPRKYFTNGNTLDQLRRIELPKTILATVFMSRENESGPWEICDDPRCMIIIDPVTKGMLVKTPAEIKKAMEERTNK